MAAITTITIIFFVFAAVVMGGGFVINSSGAARGWHEYYQSKKWNRKYSTTRHGRRDVVRFVAWFQRHQRYATHILIGVQGFSNQLSNIPALGIPFKFGNVVITLSQANGAYAVTVAANAQRRIRVFWAQV